MGRFQEYWEAQKAGFLQGGEDIARGAIADIGNAYQQILTQDSGIGPPAHLIGDMEIIESPEQPAPATDAQLQALIRTHAIAQAAADAELQEGLDANQPAVSAEMDR